MSIDPSSYREAGRSPNRSVRLVKVLRLGSITLVRNSYCTIASSRCVERVGRGAAKAGRAWPQALSAGDRVVCDPGAGDEQEQPIRDVLGTDQLAGRAGIDAVTDQAADGH